MTKLDVLATGLVVIGALNWGLVGLFQFDLVAALFGMKFGETNAITSVVYALVGLAGLYLPLSWNAIMHRRHTHDASVRA